MQTSHFYLFLAVGLSIIGWVLYQNHLLSQSKQRLNFDLLDQVQSNLSQFVERENDRREEDYRRLMDPMVPPIRRSVVGPVLPVNIPTRGEHEPFHVVGYAYKTGKDVAENMFQLYGRRLHSNKYEYYVVHPITQIKIPIYTKNDWELNQDDKVEIKGFPGKFDVEIYDIDQPRYLPY